MIVEGQHEGDRPCKPLQLHISVFTFLSPLIRVLFLATLTDGGEGVDS